MQETNCALGKLKGIVYVYFVMHGKRNRLTNEKDSDMHPFLQFVNATDIAEFMKALDLVMEQNFYGEIIPTLMGDAIPNEQITINDIADLFSENSLTRTDKRNIKETIEQWDFSNADPEIPEALYTPKIFGKDHQYPHQYTVIPLVDLIKAKNDLNTACHLYAWLFDKCDFEMVLHPSKHLPSASIACADESTGINRYYHNLSQRDSNLCYTYFSMTGGITAVERAIYKGEKSKSTLEEYVYEFFNLMLSDVTMHCPHYFDYHNHEGKGRQPYSSGNTILADMYLYFAERIPKEGAGSIGVCAHCGKMFEKRRSTKQYCGESCRKMAETKRKCPAL